MALKKLLCVRPDWPAAIITKANYANLDVDVSSTSAGPVAVVFFFLVGQRSRGGVPHEEPAP